MIRLLFAMLLGAFVASAQPKAQLSGFVQDASGSAIEDVSVAVLNLDTGVRRATRTNNTGFYAVSSLTPGEYKITVRKPGFQTLARSGITLHAMDLAAADFALEIGSAHEEITVAAPLPLMNTTDASQGWEARRRTAEGLPLNGRGLQALIDLAPGVLATPATAGEAGQFSANGQRPATNYFTVDGVSANNGVSGSGVPGQFSGGALPAMTAIGSLHNLASLGELDEMRVLTSTYAPEYGRLPGAQVAVSTRSGSNEVHGEIFGSLRHESLAAADWFANAAGIGRMPQRLADAGGSIGGPVLRNRTFFLVSGEHLRLRQPAVFQTAVPSLATRSSAMPDARRILDAFPAPDGGDLSGGAALHTASVVMPADVTTTAVRIDQALGASGSLFVRYNRTPSSNRFGYLQTNEAQFRSQTATAGVVASFGPALTNDVRIGSSRTSVDSRWLPGAASLNLASILPSPGDGQHLYGIGIRGIGQLVTGDDGSSRQTQWNLTDTLAFTTGRHQLRAGIDYQRLSPERDQAIASVTVVYDSLEQLAASVFPGYTFARWGAGASLIETLSLFAQDTWQLSPRLNLTYGVRWELTPAPSYRVPAAPPVQVGTVLPELPAIFAPAANSAEQPVWHTRLTQLAPRIGAAYRLNEPGTLVLRAGAGVFYDLGFSSAVDLVNGAPYNRWRSGVGVATLAADNVQFGFAKDLRLPFTVEWNVGVERTLTRESVLGVSYVGSSGHRLLRREARAGATPLTVLATNNGESSYNSLQLHYRSRNFRGIQGTVSYTWSHAIDTGSWDSATWLSFPNSTDRGPANFDVRHSFQAALNYTVPRARISIGSMLRARTGFPVDVVTTDHPFGFGFENDARPDLVPGVAIRLRGAGLNPAAFAAPPPGRQGTLGRNAVRGSGMAQLDLAASREFRLSERMHLQPHLEVYNVTNGPNFADPVRALSSPLFGSPVSMLNLMLGAGRPNSGLTSAFQSGGARMLQAGIMIRF